MFSLSPEVFLLLVSFSCPFSLGAPVAGFCIAQVAFQSKKSRFPDSLSFT